MNLEILLDELETCIRRSQYKTFETESIELKDGSTAGDWKAIHKSVNAFLNTEGGIIIFGIKENNEQKKYSFTGYQETQKDNIVGIAKVFTDEKGKEINVESFLCFEIKDFLEGKICLLHIQKLPVELKYIFYKTAAYERLLASKTEISEQKLAQQKEIKENLLLSRELQIVEKATIEDLSVDALNDYIYKLNEDIRIEKPKPDIAAAVNFLEKKKFVINEQVTTLGMLVCGKEPQIFLGEKAQVDCFVDSTIEVVKDKKILKGNVLSLIQRAFAFVRKNISVGVGIENSGEAMPEYSEQLIRESINNALAHRDYSENKYSQIIIKPNLSIEIRNAGVFKKNLLIEHPKHPIPVLRIIPDVKRSNPLLTDILKTYNKYEGRGIGISVLVNECLANRIDLPYYRFHTENEMSLVIHKGKLLDQTIENILESYQGYIYKKTNGIPLSEAHKLVLAYLIKSEKENQNYRYTILLSQDNNHLEAIQDLKKWDLIYAHPSSEANKPIFLADPQLLKNTFIEELRAIFGGTYDTLPPDYKDCLQIVYQYSYFSIKQSTNASEVSNYLFLKKYKSIQNHQLKEFDNFKRKIRKIFENLTKQGFIQKQDQGYIIVQNFERTKSLFDK